MASLSEQLAQFAVDADLGSLPPAVVDKAKAVTLHNLVGGLLGAQTVEAAEAAELAASQEPLPGGASVIGHPTRVTRYGAAFANSAAMHATNQGDSYEMLTHPGPCIVPSALAIAETEGASGAEFLAALACAYEVQCRIARDFIPSTQAQGFRAAPVYGVFGSAVAAGKLLGHDYDQMVATIALATNAAAGTLESARLFTQENRFHEPLAARNGIFAAAYAAGLKRVARSTLEGPAGFYKAFTGNNTGDLAHTFTGPHTASFDDVTRDLGDRFAFLDVTLKPYPTPGYNNPVITLLIRMLNGRAIAADDVESVLVEMNHLETTYPSPDHPRVELRDKRPGTTFYVTAVTIVEGGYPKYGREFDRTQGESPRDPTNPDAIRLMERVEVEGSTTRPYFSPRITMRLRDGEEIVGETSTDEYKTDFAWVTDFARDVQPGTSLTQDQMDALVAEVSTLDQASTIRPLLELCATGGPS
jgi:2-methylcitrate dehydratase PrpD